MANNNKYIEYFDIDSVSPDTRMTLILRPDPLCTSHTLPE